jgi:hypothetical protein
LRRRTRRRTLRAMNVRYFLLLALLLPGRVACGQKSEEPGEFVELSPFEVTSAEDRGYRMRSTSLLGKASGDVIPGEPALPGVPVTIIKSADAVVVQFALSNSADKQDARNKQLSTSIDAIAAAIAGTPGLRLEHREVRLTSGDRRGSFIMRGGVVTSFANIAIFAELNSAQRLYERVKQIKDLVNGAKLSGETKLIDGPAGLYLRRPNEYRKELLAKIFEDLDNVKKGLGPDFEVLVSGLGQATRLRPCSESEIELWIDYSFTIRSIRELEARKVSPEPLRR